MGVRGLRAQGFKPRHVQMLVARWLGEKLAPGTIKDRMSDLRWLAQKIGKDNIVERTNAAYGIPDRVYVTNISKAKELGREPLEDIRTPCAQMAMTGPGDVRSLADIRPSSIAVNEGAGRGMSAEVWAVVLR